MYELSQEKYLKLEDNGSEACAKINSALLHLASVRFINHRLYLELAV